MRALDRPGIVQMTKKDPFIRCEINRKIKAVPIRHAVHITEMQYANTGEAAYLFGKLVKNPKGDSRAGEVEALIREKR